MAIKIIMRIQIEKITYMALIKMFETMIKKVKQALANGEGCRIFEGPIHVNVSHIIHDLSFGPKYPGIHNPLDETSRILRGSSGTFKYYIKIVPTEYGYLSKEVLPTNQFSVTEYYSPINEYDRTWPGLV
ncbi:Endoplasmic reticulum-Golgi intermediate compartment protein 3 [Camellia lanceoleosa]|nr:Endoplasmic reticulum-Golgi intermediate compartment protein 3 [Camellia lanceoleosa]